MACPRLSGCPLFRQFKEQASLKIWAAYYCESRFENCERLKLSKTGAAVPGNMLPNGKLLDNPPAT